MEKQIAKNVNEKIVSIIVYIWLCQAVTINDTSKTSETEEMYLNDSLSKFNKIRAFSKTPQFVPSNKGYLLANALER